MSVTSLQDKLTLKTNNTPFLYQIFISIAAGISLNFAFAPYHYFLIAFFAPAVLLIFCYHARPARAFWLGMSFGASFFAASMYWIFISLHSYGHAPIWFALPTTVLLILVLALFIAIPMLLNARFASRNLIAFSLLAFPFSWVLFEWIRGWIFTGCPWLFLGYAQTPSFLSGLASVFGVYGVSLATLMIAGSLVLVISHRRLSVKLFAFILIILLLVSAYFLKQQHWTKPAGKAISTTLIQGNIAQSLKWQPEQITNTLNIYKNLTEQNWHSEIIIWPEAAVPVFASYLDNFLMPLSDEAKSHHTALIIGIPINNPQTGAYYNGMMGLGASQGTYFKRHLVPFGEYQPLQFLLSKLLKYLNIPMSGFSEGPAKQPPFKVKGHLVAPFICYEIAYPAQVRTYSKNTGFLITLTDDAWFGQSNASAQHLQIGQMRAIETGRPMAFATNDGITAFINSKGHVTARAPKDIETVLTAKITPTQGNTPWMTWGYSLILTLLFIGYLLSFKKILGFFTKSKSLH